MKPNYPKSKPQTPIRPEKKFDDRPARNYDERPAKKYDDRPARNYDERPAKQADARPIEKSVTLCIVSQGQKTKNAM